MIALSSLKAFIGLLDTLDMRYFVSGGVGLDGLRGHISREHKDLDIYVMVDDLEVLFSALKRDGYRCFRKLNKYQIQNEWITVDILPLTDEGTTYLLNGNAADTRYPKELFDNPQQGQIDDLLFPVVPGEIFAFDMPYSKHVQDKRFAESIRFDHSRLVRIQEVQKKKPQEISLEEL